MIALAPVLGSTTRDRQHGLAHSKCVALPLIATQNRKIPSSHQEINSECSAIQVLSKTQLWKSIFMESLLKPYSQSVFREPQVGIARESQSSAVCLFWALLLRRRSEKAS